MRTRLVSPTIMVFFALILLVVLWIGSGMIGRDSTEEAEPAPIATPTVAASWSEAQDITRELVLYGDIEPAQVASVRARTDGIVEQVAQQGTEVAAGDLVAELSIDDRAARLARAEAQLSAAQRDYDAARQLYERDVGPEAEVRARLAQLEAARAELRAIELEIGNTRLGAPIGGVVNQVIAEAGAYVSLGGEVVEIVENDPLIAVVHVQQTAISNIRSGMPARIRFIGGSDAEGVLRFVSPLADAATRTFRVEVEIQNPDRALPSGLSAEVTIPYETVPAHRVSAALGRLNEEGQLGIYIVTGDNLIDFAPVEIIRAQADGVWVTGLPEKARIVTISQGTLAPGQEVEVRETPEEYADPGGAAVGRDNGAAEEMGGASGEAAGSPASATSESPE